MATGKEHLVWKKTTLQQQEEDVLRYSANLSPRERLCLLSALQKRAYPEIYKDHKAYYARCMAAPIIKRKIDW